MNGFRLLGHHQRLACAGQGQARGQVVEQVMHRNCTIAEPNAAARRLRALADRVEQTGEVLSADVEAALGFASLSDDERAG